MPRNPQELDAAWRAAWAPPEKLLPSEWAERYRILPSGVSAEPGRWSNRRTPYAVGIINATVEPGVERVVIVAGTQVGKSETIRNLCGYWIDNDSGPALLVMPDERSAKDAIAERIKPMLMASPKLRRHVSDRAWDTKLTAIHLDTMSLFVGWAGSPQSLASRPCRYALFDEVDKYPPYSGDEADPISLGVERTTTYGHRRRIIITSTPTTREGAVWREFEACGQRRYYHVACPHCGEFQRLIWPQVKWEKQPEEMDKFKAADLIETKRLAWYECVKCKGRIEDRHKPKMLEGGEWRSEGHPGPSVGFHLSGLYSPWRTFAKFAAEFIRCKGDPARTQNFRNSWLAEPHEDVAATVRPSVVRERVAKSPKPGIVPTWAQALIATADTQKDCFYWTIRAWGAEYRSHLVANGIAYSFDELARETLLQEFPMGSVKATPQVLLIDSGGTKSDQGISRTQEVYEFAARDPSRIWPTKGASQSRVKPYSLTPIGTAGVYLRVLDTEVYKDSLSRLLGDPDPSRWLPHADVLEDYCIQMASEHKVRDHKTGKLFWTTVTTSAPNHWWDCEVLQVAGADMLNVGLMTIPGEPDGTPQPTPQPFATSYRK